MEHSQLLRQSEYFFKCTGKMFCRNFAAIADLIARNNIGNMFWRLFENALVDRNLVDARFFYTSCGDFQRLILPAYDQASETRILEYQLSVGLESLSRGTSFRPQLSGFSGALGVQCQESYLGELEVAYPCWYSVRQGK